MLKRLAAFLGFLCLVLLLLAFDEGQVKRGLSTVREQVGPATQRVIKGARERMQAASAEPAPPIGGPSPVGAFAPLDAAPGGEVRLERARIMFESVPPLRTRPARIAYGREAFAAPLNLPPDHQIELREVTPMDVKTPVAPSPVCGGAVPGWVALTRHGGRLLLMIWPAGPAPDQVEAVPCLSATYRATGR